MEKNKKTIQICGVDCGPVNIFFGFKPAILSYGFGRPINYGSGRIRILREQFSPTEKIMMSNRWYIIKNYKTVNFSESLLKL